MFDAFNSDSAVNRLLCGFVFCSALLACEEPSTDFLYPDFGAERTDATPQGTDMTAADQGRFDGGVDVDAQQSTDAASGELEDASAPSPDMEPVVVDVDMTTSSGVPIYAAGQTHSGLPEDIVDGLMEIRRQDDRWQDDVFLKAGASSTVSRNTLHCFAGPNVDLGAYAYLQDTLDYFLSGEAANTTPFDRETVAALVGHNAGWVIEGDPSPLETEKNAIEPRYALVHYGTNDMGLGSTYASASRPFYDHMTQLVDGLSAEGIVSILIGISPRADRPSADRWVRSYNAIIRGIAQSRGLPFVDLFHATADVPGYGLSADGIHLNRAPDGACQLTEDGLEFGYNVRNLVVLEALDRVRRATIDGDTVDDVLRMTGTGTHAEPFEVLTVPFAHSADTSSSTERRYDDYPACDDADESGPEVVYRWTTDRPRRIRAMVFDSGAVDIDIHMLGADGTAASCLDRDHHLIETTVEAGTYHFVLDSFTSSDGDEKSGPFLFVLLDCDPDDVDCD